MNKSRNYGIDLLRIITMLGVVTLHILGHGGVLAGAVRANQFDTAWLLEVIGYPAVDCFLIISGFVGCKKVLPSLKSVVTLYLTVLLYSVSICAIMQHFYPDVIATSEIGKAFMPVTTYQYWFFTCYIGMLALSPLINGFVNYADKKTLYTVGIIIFLVFSVYGAYSMHHGDRFKLANGYSVMWFIPMYALGAIIKKTEFYKKIPVYVALPTLALAYLSTWLIKINSVGDVSVGMQKLSQSLANYISPTIVIAAVMSVCLFAKINVKHKFLAGLITFFSSSAFSVYLIHDNNYFRDNIIVGAFKTVGDYSPVMLVLTVLAIALVIFVVCVLIDKVRVLLFKILHIEKLCDLIQKKFI